jgi:hypothetical protein
MLALLSDIWISICWKHGEIQKSVHLKSLGAFHSLFNKSSNITEKSYRSDLSNTSVTRTHVGNNHKVYLDSYFMSVDWSVTALTFSVPQYAIWLPSCSLYHNMPLDCPHVHYTTTCHLTALTFITPQHAIWLLSHSVYHNMPPNCPYVHHTTIYHSTALMFIFPQHVMWLQHVHCTVQ